MKRVFACLAVVLAVLVFPAWEAGAKNYTISMTGTYATTWSLGAVSKGCASATVNRVGSSALFVYIPDNEPCNTSVPINVTTQCFSTITLNFTPDPSLDGAWSSLSPEGDGYILDLDYQCPQGHPH